ncbi:hypothetical protein JGK43_002443 [Edwardsiella piscicida]|nr:hypothetical protein [Edwardsiella piscicida]ELM3730552.1 hypothetical protein [Edwardsiella piscicida]ELV7537992.1 hypothetical protein [Edwardsiella piscicida]
MSQVDKQELRKAELENDELRQKLANAEHQLYMAELAKHNLRASRKAQFRKRRSAEKRIAELEAKTVSLPKLPVLGSNADWYQGFAAGTSCMRNDCADAIHAAGIGVNVEDKA